MLIEKKNTTILSNEIIDLYVGDILVFSLHVFEKKFHIREEVGLIATLPSLFYEPFDTKAAAIEFLETHLTKFAELCLQIKS